MLLTPNNWNELTWAQFSRLSAVESEDPIGLVCAVLGQSRDTVEKMRKQEFEQVLLGLTFLSEPAPTHVCTSITINGVEYGFDPYVLRVRDFVNLEVVQDGLRAGQPEAVVKFLACVLRPQSFDDADSDEITARLMELLPSQPYTAVHGMFFFVATVLSGSTASLTKYLVERFQKNRERALLHLAVQASSGRPLSRLYTPLQKFGINLLTKFFYRLVTNSSDIGNGKLRTVDKLVLSILKLFTTPRRITKKLKRPAPFDYIVSIFNTFIRNTYGRYKLKR